MMIRFRRTAFAILVLLAWLAPAEAGTWRAGDVLPIIGGCFDVDAAVKVAEAYEGSLERAARLWRAYQGQGRCAGGRPIPAVLVGPLSVHELHDGSRVMLWEARLIPFAVTVYTLLGVRSGPHEDEGTT